MTLQKPPWNYWNETHNQSKIHTVERDINHYRSITSVNSPNVLNLSQWPERQWSFSWRRGRIQSCGNTPGIWSSSWSTTIIMENSIAASSFAYFPTIHPDGNGWIPNGTLSCGLVTLNCACSPSVRVCRVPHSAFQHSEICLWALLLCPRCGL